ncbi:MAG: carbohydrate ABC transporter permease [candidate division Zixibacteria bacterium]|nr:carbohydrate ABC transporter permease [candidate division Zixibacteria bacterium]
MLWMFRVAFLPAGAGLDIADVMSGAVTLANFADLFTDGSIVRALFNSLVVGLVVTLGNILFCFMVGYALARYRTIANKLAFGSCLIVLMIPAHVVIIPLYIMAIKSGWYDSYAVLIIPWLVTPIGIFLVKQYIEGIPSSLEEAARVDGASEPAILFRIVMPVCKPVLVVLAIQVFVTNWNSFLYPFILTSRESLRTLPVALAMLQGHQAIDWPHLMAGSALAVLPVLAVFFVMQRHILSGIMSGGIKQ